MRRVFRISPVAAGVLPLLLAASCSPAPTEAGAGAPAGSRLLVVGGNNQVAVACTQLDEPLAVLLQDASGRPLANVAISWGVTRSSGELLTTQDRTDASGRATATWLLGLGATQTVIVSSGQATSATFTATSVANPSPPRTCS